MNAGSPQQSQRNRAQNPTDGRLTSTRAGKLLGRALNQPLTAVSLAAYLKNASNSSEETVTPAHYVQAQLRQDYLEQKIVRPPPGFINQTPRMITAENRLSDAPTPFPQGLAGVPTSYVQHQDLYATPQAASRRSQKQPRRHTRTNKRSDQGPMPSAADIYPDDSDWVRIPFSRTPQRHLAQQTFDQSSPSTRIQVNNPVNWPTPAEVYTPRDPVQNLQVVFNNLQLQQSQHGTHTQQLQQAQPHHHDQKLQSALATFSPPTREDYNALDDEVMSLINELPRLSFTTMANFGALDIDQDTSQTTTTQEDMARYGLTRIGIGADWSGAADAKGSWETPRPFGVRPRDHQGWGGWEWAMRNGWGEE